jgi:hypothetical protein
MSEPRHIEPDYFKGYESTFDTILQCEFSKVTNYSPELAAAHAKMVKGLHEFQEALTEQGFTGDWNA